MSSALAALVLSSCAADEGRVPAASAAPTTASPSPVSSPPPTVVDETAAPSVGTTTLPPVGLGQEADFGGGVLAAVTGLDPVDVAAEGPGDIAGPGVAVRLELRNGSAGPVDLTGVSVTASTGGGVPASPSAGDPAAPMEGSLEAGEVRAGTYVFRVPTGEERPLRVEVGLDSSPLIAVVEG